MKYFKNLMVLLVTLALSFAAYAEETTSISQDSGKTLVSTGKYITGGIIASTVGFGIGHAIQNRWSEKGWIFTAAESSGMALMVAGLSSCSKTTDIYGAEKTDCSNAGLIATGAGVLIGFHIWEIVDAWAGATPLDDNSPKVFLVPDPKAPRLAIAWKF